jgi:anti-sigma B factor antagonist
VAERSEQVPDLLEVEVAGEGARRTVALRGELDVVTSPQLRETMLGLVDNGVRVVDIDLSGLELIDSTGLGVLVGVLKRVLQHGGELRLRSPQRATRKVLSITGLDRVFTVIE